MEYVKNNLWVMWLGFSLGESGIYFDSMAFWFILVPTVALVEFVKDSR